MEFEEDVARGLVAQANLDAVNAVDPRVACRSAAQDLDAGPRKKSEVSQVVAYLFGQIDGVDYARGAHLRVAESCEIH
jgi:hypothetical protein